jgi:hypothetical protein
MFPRWCIKINIACNSSFFNVNITCLLLPWKNWIEISRSLRKNKVQIYSNPFHTFCCSLLILGWSIHLEISCSQKKIFFVEKAVVNQSAKTFLPRIFFFRFSKIFKRCFEKNAIQSRKNNKGYILWKLWDFNFWMYDAIELLVKHNLIEASINNFKALLNLKIFSCTK